MTTLGVMLEIETNDRRLTPENIDAAMKSPRGVQALRDAVLLALKKRVTRVVAVMPIEQMRMLSLLHEAVGEDLAGEPMFVKPPADYVPPTNE